MRSHIQFPGRIVSAVFILLLLSLYVLNLSMGPIPLSLPEALGQVFSPEDSIASLIVREIRIPRATLALVVGMTLGIAGAALQGLLRNPLAGPGLLGVSNCAALGAVVTLYYGLAQSSWFVLPLGGMIGALVSVVLIFMLAGRQSGILNLILAGVAINAVASSFIALALNFADNPYAMSEMVYWLLGSVSNRSLDDLGVAIPFMALGWLMLLLSRNFLDALSLGEDTARSLGFSTVGHRAIVVTGVAASVGAAVSVSGNIGFVGLVVPHLLRPLVGHEPGRLLPLSALGGGILLLAADCTVQLISPAQELKLGVVTALVGGPFFLMLIYRMRNEAI
jgi:iron complex transport system permease protein